MPSVGPALPATQAPPVLRTLRAVGVPPHRRAAQGSRRSAAACRAHHQAPVPSTRPRSVARRPPRPPARALTRCCSCCLPLHLVAVEDQLMVPLLHVLDGLNMQDSTPPHDPPCRIGIRDG